MLFSRVFNVMALICGLALASTSDAADFQLIDGFDPGQRVILVKGEIVPGDDYKFFELTARAERAIIYLESPGGDVETGLSMGSEIAMRGFTTLVLEGPGCHSICAVIWVSGMRRYMAPTANISVHAAYGLVNKEDGTVSAIPSGVWNASIGAYLNEVGLSRKAIEYFTMARPDEPLLPITPEIAQLLDLDVYIQNGLNVTTPAERPTPRQITRQMADYIALSNNCAELLGVDAQMLFARGEGLLKTGHELFGPEVFIPLISEQVGVTKHQMEKQGVVRWCLQADANLRAEGLDTGVTGPSFDCAQAVSATEVTLCSSKDLWTLDRVMASVYFHYKRASTGMQATTFVDTQRAWLKRRDECGGNVACLQERYSSRLFDFGF
jgi:uncharacterized protein YecT (DUF1311 family)